MNYLKILVVEVHNKKKCIKVNYLLSERKMKKWKKVMQCMLKNQ